MGEAVLPSQSPLVESRHRLTLGQKLLRLSVSKPSPVTAPPAPSIGDGVHSGNADFMLSLARGLHVLRSFPVHRPYLTVADCARATGISVAAARRCLYTLTQLGYVQKADGIYKLTPDVLHLGVGYVPYDWLACVARPFLRHLAADIKAPCSLTVQIRDQATCLVSEGRLHVSQEFTVGAQLPVLATAAGRVLAARCDNEYLARILKYWKPRRCTVMSTVDRDTILPEIERVRAQGFAVVAKELVPSVTSLAVPILWADGAVAAITVLVHRRYDQDSLRRDLIPRVQTAAQAVAAALVR